MQNPLMQTIEALAKEKGIEADTIITAIEDAVLTASRKYYKTNENLKTRFNQETGQVDLFAIKHIVPEVSNEATEISLKEAQDLYGEEAEVDMEIEFPKRTDVLGRIAARHNITWKWVRGHTGVSGNEMADALANQGIDELR
jgi:N utilization substance protein A